MPTAPILIWTDLPRIEDSYAPMQALVRTALPPALVFAYPLFRLKTSLLLGSPPTFPSREALPFLLGELAGTAERERAAALGRPSRAGMNAKGEPLGRADPLCFRSGATSYDKAVYAAFAPNIPSIAPKKTVGGSFATGSFKTYSAADPDCWVRLLLFSEGLFLTAFNISGPTTCARRRSSLASLTTSLDARSPTPGA